MKKKLIILGITAVFTFSLASFAYAQTVTPTSNQCSALHPCTMKE
ncbi:hypothetical protein [Paenibacillus albiflavus]|nr:hypothetical protein [Paenibacillus albiflavus]